ncbi:hypothetical protein [Actinoplanes subtropicus]|uniref:hypothetical protein n=1 Tax=Actinoplanes subtropicus TaxID=543632 RepID=UPI0004C396E3|nr:hypothetical protein [Actinoplanes subtropicus]
MDLAGTGSLRVIVQLLGQRTRWPSTPGVHAGPCLLTVTAIENSAKRSFFLYEHGVTPGSCRVNIQATAASPTMVPNCSPPWRRAP